MDGTTSAASRSRSPASSETSVAHVGPPKTDEATPAPRHSVAAHPEASARRSDLPAGALTCEWDDCGARFGDVPGLVAHLENGHIGVHKSSYTCEWASCPRRGLVQTSRFALVSHCRSHTGEKPFVCSVPECDKSFTRSDTLAKHLRQQHNIATPTPVRGGYRKRKRSMTPPLPPPPLPVPPPPERHVSHSPPPLLPPAPGEAYAPSHYNFANRAYAQFHDPRDSGFNTFRVNPAIHDRPAPSVSSTMRLQAEGLVDRPPREEYFLPEQREEEVASSSEEEDGGKPYNAEAMGGRSKAMVKYLIMKAKYRYIMDERGLLMDQLDALKREEKEEWREKEASVDRILRGFGPDSERLIRTPDIPTNGKRSRGPVSLSPQEDPGAVTEGHPPSHPSHPRHDHRMEVDAR